MPVLGIDTSSYTTSVALIEGSKLIAEKRALLAVPKGGRGLQQSNAFFQHVQNLPRLIDELGLGAYCIDAVAASGRPRPTQGSYMPVFTAGVSVAKSLAAALGVCYFETSHQEGHIAAGCFSIGWRPDDSFLAFHISGGTTELLIAKPNTAGYGLALLGGTKDLHAGQFVDRVGVALGLGFPSGPELENLAMSRNGATEDLIIKANVTGMDCSLSGAESSAQRLIASGAEAAMVAFGVQRCLAGVFVDMAAEAVRRTGIRKLLAIGGVASNKYIRKRMADDLGSNGIEVMFAANPFSSDNAVGVACIGQKFLYRGGA
jgi:N6-L-threonylcarbamoyladenine synthase